MLALFSNNQVSTAFPLAVYAFLLHAAAITGFVPAPHEKMIGAGALYADAFGWLQANTLYSTLAATVLVYFQAFWLSNIVDRYRMLHDRSWLPAVAYILVASLLPDFLFLSPVLVGITFIIPVLSRIFAAYKQPSLHALVFDAGFWTAVGSLFYAPLLWFLPAVFAGFFILRSFDLRYQVILLTGVFVPVFLASTVYFWLNRGVEFYGAWTRELGGLYSLRFEASRSDLYKLSLAAFLLVLLLLNAGEYYRKRLIQVQKYVNVLFGMVLCSLLLFVTRTVFYPEFLLAAVLPAGIFLSMTLESFSRKWVSELLHLLLLAGIFILQFLPFLGL